LFTLLSKSTQEVPQQVSPPPQSGPVPPQRQPPLLHCSPESQALLQAPQWFGSVAVTTQDVPQQVSVPATQSGPVPPQLQTPLTHCSPESQVTGPQGSPLQRAFSQPKSQNSRFSV